MHGFAIAEAIGYGGEECEVYAALHRLELDGILTSAWGIGQEQRRAKYYCRRAARAERPELLLEALALMSLVGVAAAKDGVSCVAAAAPVSFSGRIASVRAVVNGVPATFVIDTASDTIVNADRLHLFVLHAFTASTVTTSGAAPVAWNLVRIGQFTVGGQEVRKRTVLAKSLRDLETALGREVDGILGNDVLNQWDAVTLDYKNRKLILDCSGENRDER
jgi:hypothetical protein